MTVFIPNVSNTDTFQKWLSVTNQLANAISNTVVTTSGSVTTGDAAISGTYIGNGINVSVATVSSNIVIGNSSVNGTISSTFFTGIANNSNYFGGFPPSSYVSGTQLQANLSNYALQSSLSNYALQSSLSNYALQSSLSNYALQSSLSNYALLSGGLFTGSVNATSYTVGTSLVANSSGVYTAGAINAATGIVGTNNTGVGVFGITNTSVGVYGQSTTSGIGVTGISNTGIGISTASNTGLGLYVQSSTGTIAQFVNSSATIATINSTGFYTTGTVNAASYNVGSSFVANNTTLKLGTSFVANSKQITFSGNLVAGAASYVSNGFSVVAYNVGVVSSGTTTPSPYNGNYQYLNANGAFTLAAPAADCAIDLLITNGTAAGSITFSGFTVSSYVGDSYATTSGYNYLFLIRRINSVSTYIIKALQ